MSLELKVFSPAMVYANCYILRDTESGEALVIDPGVYNRRFQAMLINEGIVSLKYILLTHGHFDHITGVAGLKNEFGGEVVIHNEDEVCLSSKEASLAKKFFFVHNDAAADIVLNGGEELRLGAHKIRVLHTPGHTRGSVCYIVSDLIFSGDTLFKDSIGRTDFPGGSEEEILYSLKKLAELEGDYKVYPGHSAETTLERERCFNPHMKGL